MVPDQNMVSEQCMVLEPEDLPIPDADDLVIEVLTDQMFDFDEKRKGRAGDLRSGWWDRQSS